MQQLQAIKADGQLESRLGLDNDNNYISSETQNTPQAIRTIGICGKNINILIGNHLIHALIAQSRSKDPPENLNEHQAKETIYHMLDKTKALKDWAATFEHVFFNHCEFTSITVDSIDMFGSRIGFLKFKTDMKYNYAYEHTYDLRARTAKEDNIKTKIRNLALKRLRTNEQDTKQLLEDRELINRNIETIRSEIEDLIEHEDKFNRLNQKIKKINKVESEITKIFKEENNMLKNKGMIPLPDDTLDKRLTNDNIQKHITLEITKRFNEENEKLKEEKQTEHPAQILENRIKAETLNVTDDERAIHGIVSAKLKEIDKPKIPSIVFMRGASVAILIKINAPDNMAYSILVTQPRVAVGKYSIAELPAGMMDDSDNFAGTAAKELEEETGIKINQNKLIDLTQMMQYDYLYPSCGACDENMRFYFFETDKSKEEIADIQGKCTGAYEEGESIKLLLVPFDRLADHSPDMKTLTALYLYETTRTRTIESRRKLSEDKRLEMP
jgi:8-oxo-dGTP pyrophosphatase MutT (NUDIX family)